ncbi:UNVERIFIED_CONTAM: hypothetical protein FKN15_051830 [Acipenser sinensis]
MGVEQEQQPGRVQCLEMTTKRKLIGRLVPCRCFRGEEEVISVLDYSHCSLQQVPKEIFSFERTLEELYLDANQIEELPKTKCFICGIGSDYFDTTPHGFETHTLEEHNLANYMFFLMYLINKDDTEHTGQINVNGQEFYLFQHRMPCERVDTLDIAGDIVIKSLNIIGGGAPQGGMPGYGGGFMPVSLELTVGSPRVSVLTLFPGCRFNINFLVGYSRDIVFHLNPRILENVVVRNSFIGGSWGQEEMELEFNPFQAGQYFDVSAATALFIYHKCELRNTAIQ